MFRTFPNMIWMEHEMTGIIWFPNQIILGPDERKKDRRALPYIVAGHLEREGLKNLVNLNF